MSLFAGRSARVRLALMSSVLFLAMGTALIVVISAGRGGASPIHLSVGGGTGRSAPFRTRRRRFEPGGPYLVRPDEAVIAQQHADNARLSCVRLDRAALDGAGGDPARLVRRRSDAAAGARDHRTRPHDLGRKPARAAGADAALATSSRSWGRRSTTCSAGSRPRSTRSAGSWPTPRTSCGRRSRWSGRCCRWRSPIPTQAPRRCAAPARSCWSPAATRSG